MVLGFGERCSWYEGNLGFLGIGVLDFGLEGGGIEELEISIKFEIIIGFVIKVLIYF